LIGWHPRWTIAGKVDCLFVTYAGLPRLDPHDRLVTQRLRERGISAGAAVWTDPSIDWSSATLCVLRSTWDYHQVPARFLGWLDQVASQAMVRNHPSIVRWNAHKFYLRDLAEKGVPIVPTSWLRRGATATIESLLAAHATEELIIKPAHGASSFDVLHVQRGSTAQRRGQAHLNRLLRAEDVLVQPFLRTLADYPERALMFIEGAFTHAVSKTPFQTALPSGEAGDAPLAEPTGEEVAIATRAIQSLPERPLFARVDLVRDEHQRPCVLELELIEPTLFLGMHPPSVIALADAIAALLSSK
jgi:glutathione synthase/RimK-type ligase-like ATP-grasp enzyme